MCLFRQGMGGSEFSRVHVKHPWCTHPKRNLNTLQMPLGSHMLPSPNLPCHLGIFYQVQAGRRERESDALHLGTLARHHRGLYSKPLLPVLCLLSLVFMLASCTRRARVIKYNSTCKEIFSFIPVLIIPVEYTDQTWVPVAG